MKSVLYSEWLKLKRSKALLSCSLGTCIVPLFVLFNSIQRYLKNPSETIDLFGLYDGALLFLMLLFAPLALSVIAAYTICREYSEKTLKTIFTVPVSRMQFLAGKFCILFMITILFMLISWFHILILAVLCSFFVEVGQLTPVSAVFFLMKMLSGALLLYMTLTPIVYFSIRNKGFTAPFIVSAAVCLFNVVLSGSGIAGWFPWTASYLLINGRSGHAGCPPHISFLIIVCLCVISVSASTVRFLREDIS